MIKDDFYRVIYIFAKRPLVSTVSHLQMETICQLCCSTENYYANKGKNGSMAFFVSLVSEASVVVCLQIPISVVLCIERLFNQRNCKNTLNLLLCC